MAFKNVVPQKNNYKDIEALFRDLSSNKVESLYSHQADILRSYQREAFEKPNVAIELPTGSGKTLVGLLIGEYKRVVNGDRILYLCPTKQLVNQVVDLAKNRYGIKAEAYTGPSTTYSASLKSSYQNSDCVAVTTYSSLFNINPFFKNSNLIIADDAHSAENYVSSAWSVQILRKEHEHIYDSIIEKLKEYIDYQIYLRLTHPKPLFHDKYWVDKLSFKYLYENLNEFYVLFDGLFNESNLKYSWHNIKNNLHACNIFFGWNEILIRPIIPPSMENSAFAQAKQRIFMSATLGNGGDLERVTGIKKFHKINIPEGWDKEGLGRRFFVFPQQSIEEAQVTDLIDKVIDATPRTVVLLSSDAQLKSWESHFSSNPERPVAVFSAKDVEQSKSEFIKSDKGVMLLANRFDGMDFAGDESRALIVSEIPYSSNYQEKFLQSRLNANVIFYDRNRTRLIQAIGRCTRSPKDYSLVLVIGDELFDWLTHTEKRQFFHPELQAELKFGLDQSRNIDLDGFIENINIFLEQDVTWKSVESQILSMRDQLQRATIPGETQLNDVVQYEIDYLYSLWNKDYPNAYSSAFKILEGLSGGEELRGYRGFWAYLCGSCAWVIGKENNDELFIQKSTELINKAALIAPSINWLRKINSDTYNEAHQYDQNFLFNIEQLSVELINFKINNINKFQQKLNEIEKSLFDKNKLEYANENIGKLLGYITGNNSSSTAPDPWWLSSNDLLYVFEDKLYHKADEYIPMADIRQTMTHKPWIEENIPGISQNAKIFTILITNRYKIEKIHAHACKDLYYWNYEDFQKWAIKVISKIRLIATKYTGISENTWQDYLVSEFTKSDYHPNKLINECQPLSSIVESI